MHVGVVGAGAIGGYLAAELSAGGARVTLVHRKGAAGAEKAPLAVRADGIVFKQTTEILLTDSLDALRGADACLVTVKSRDTEAAADALAGALSPDTVVVTFQNGLRNAEILRARLGERVTPGVVTYNVFIDERGRRRQATTGKLLAGLLPGPGGMRLRALREAFRAAGERLDLRADIDRVLLGKLLLNLNNGVCAATGLGIAASLLDRDARACFAHCLREGLHWMSRAGLRPARVTALPPALLPLVLGLPGPLVDRAARAIAGIGAAARGSTLQDLDRGRATEIDELNGAIAAIARRAGGSAPINELVTRIVHEHERAAAAGQPPDFVPPGELRARMERILASPG